MSKTVFDDIENKLNKISKTTSSMSGNSFSKAIENARNNYNAKTNTSKAIDNIANRLSGNNTRLKNTLVNTMNSKINDISQNYAKAQSEPKEDESLWSKINKALESNLPEGTQLVSSVNSNNIGLGIDAQTRQNVSDYHDKVSTEKLLNGEKSNKYANLFGIEDTGYQLTDDDIKKIGGVVVDKKTGQNVSEYANNLNKDINDTYEKLNTKINALNLSAKLGKISEEDYKNQYNALTKEWKDNETRSKELGNFEYKEGKDYYEWLKQNGTEDEIKQFERYVGSFDDSYMESLANSYKATLVDFANTIPQAIDMAHAYIDKDDPNGFKLDDPNNISSRLSNLSNELKSYTTNGVNDVGVRKYSLQTISSLMPMINDAIIFTLTAGALGWEGQALQKGVSLATNIQFGLNSAAETTRQRLAEGNTFETSFYNGVTHGVITGLVEGLNVGNVVNITNLLTGAGSSILGVGLSSLPKGAEIAKGLIQSGIGEGVEEIAEAYADKLVDNITNAISGDKVIVTDTTWGGIGESGLTDQFIMAAAGAVLLGMPSTIAVTVDSKAKYNAAQESKKYWQQAQEYYTKTNDIENLNKVNQIINVINNECKTYVQNNPNSFAINSENDIASPAPSFEEAMNITANAFKLDVSDTIQQAEANKTKALDIYGQLQTELTNRGMYGINKSGTDTKGVDVDTYVKMSPELRTQAKELLNYANELGVDYKIDDNFNVYRDGKLVNIQLNANENGANAQGNIINNPFSNDIQNNSDVLSQTLSHELVHLTEKSGKYANLQQSVIDALGEDFESYKQNIANLYSNYVNNEEDLMKEVVAKYVEENLGSQEFIHRLSVYDSSVLSRLYEGMKTMLTNNPQSKVANEFFKAFRDSQNLVTSAETQYSLKGRNKDLLVVHNLSNEKLDKALELGGLVMPSIAVTKDTLGHDGYGAITLLFDKNTIDPSNKDNVVLSGDAFSPRIPNLEFEIRNVGKLRKYLYSIVGVKDSNALRGDSLMHIINQNFLQSNYSRENLILDELKVSAIMQKTFLQNNGINVDLIDTNTLNNYDEKHEAENENVRRIINAQREYGNNYSQDYEKWATEIANKLKDKLDVKSGYRNNKEYFTENGNARTFKSLHEEATPENVLKIMKELTKKGVINAETDFGNGRTISNYRAAATKKFQSIQEIIDNEEMLSKFDEEEYFNIMDNARDELTKIQNDFVEKSGFDNRESAVGFTSVEYLTDDFINAKNFKKALSIAKDNEKRLGTKAVSENDYKEFYTKLQDFKRALSNISTGYFEAKPQRIVKFNEIKAAIIPSFSEKTLSNETLQKLYRMGVDNVVLYDPMLDGDRQRVTNETADKLDIKFSISKNDIDTYNKAVEDNDIETAQAIVNKVAKEKQYYDESNYQGTSAFNGTAPNNAWGYANNEEAFRDYENDTFEGDFTLGMYKDYGIDTNDLDFKLNDKRAYVLGDKFEKESISNLRQALNSEDGTITMYRSVPKDVKESSFRNGDWITPSKEYAIDNAAIHGWGNDYNLIEQKVSINDIWWDGNDINEWGYDDGKNYAYKNVENNVKSLEPITYDDNGNVIPLEERFNEDNDDIRYSLSKPSETAIEYTDYRKENPDDDVTNTFNLSKGQVEYFKNSKMRDSNRRLKVMYHGTQYAGFTSFDVENGAFFTDSPYIAATYSQNGYVEHNPYVEKSFENENDYFGSYKVFLNLTNPYVYDVKGKTYDWLPSKEKSGLRQTIRDYTKYAKENGYDGLIIENVRDTSSQQGGYFGNKGSFDPAELSTIAVAFNQDQIKSIYNQNPTTNPDIRYSISDETNNLINRLSKNFIEDNNLYNVNDNDLKAILNDINKEIDETGSVKSGSVKKLFDFYIDNAVEYGEDLSGEYKSIFNYLRNNPINTEQIKQDYKKGDVRAFMDQLREVGFNFKNGSVRSQDIIIQELLSKHPDMASVVDENGGVGQLQDVYDYVINLRDNMGKTAQKVINLYDQNEVESFATQKATELVEEMIATKDKISKRYGEMATRKNWLDNATKVVDQANAQGGELTVDDISSIITQNGVTEKTIERMEKSKQIMIDNAPKWIMGYDTLKAEYPMFSKDTLNNALYETLVEGQLSGKTYDAMANTLSADFELEGVQGNIKNEINEFIKECLETFSNETKYKAGQINTKVVNNAIKQNTAYNQSDIQGSYEQMLKGDALNRQSSQIKKDYQAIYQPIVENLIDVNSKIRETKGRNIDSKISHWKTIDQNLKVLANGNANLYNQLHETIRVNCLDKAASTKQSLLQHAQGVIDQVKALGITQGTKEDIATQYIMEKHTEKLTKGGTPYESYDVDRLKKEFNYKMANGKYAYENIQEAARLLRNAYDSTIDEVNRTQINANGDIEGKEDAETTELLIKVNEAFDTLQTIKDEIRRNGSKESTQAAYEIQKKKYNRLVKQYNNRIEQDEKGDLTRRNLTPYRENYSHHITKNNIVNTIKGIKNTEFQVPTELAGTSDYTKPNTMWSSFSAAQDGGRYTPTALGSYSKYMEEASNVIAFNPVILELKQFNADIKNNAQGTQLNKLSEYLTDYVNMLAGKRNNFDRGAEKIVGAKAMKIVKALNKYAKGAALSMNFRSGLVQFANLPNGFGILEAKGGMSYVKDVAKGLQRYLHKDTVINQSPFMNNRYFDFDTGEKSFSKSLKDKADFVLTFGDKVGAEMIWHSAYAQAERLNVKNPINYADDVTRSAIAGRTKEDMAIAMNSEVLNLLLPFQVENNNLFQTLKEETSNKQFGAVMSYMVTAYLFNMAIKGITGGDDEILPEFITPIAEELKKALTEDQDAGTTVKNALLGEVGEFISLMPVGSQLVGMSFGDDAESIFGDYNPSRYGMTNIGVSGLVNATKDLIDSGTDARYKAVKVLEDLIGGYVKGGKQLTRTVGGLQSMGAIPKVTPKGDVETSPINYTKKGKVAYVNDQSNIGDWVKASLFGKSNTSEAQKYYSNFNSLSDSDKRKFDALQSQGNNAYESYQTIKTNNENKAEAKAEKEKGNKDYDETTLREQLISEGKYESYKDQVNKAYGEYLNEYYSTDHDEDEGPKSYTQFAKLYGLSANDLKQDTYGKFYEKYKINEKTQKVFNEAMDIKNSKNALGKTIANSGAAQRRKIYEEQGIYDQVLEFIEDNELEYSDFGLTKTVVNASEDELNKIIAKIEGKTIETSSTTKSSGGSGGSSSKSSNKTKKAMLKYMETLINNSPDVFDLLKKSTSIEDAKKNVEKILAKQKKGY